mmetsp:Transcript_3509/g.7304  ORF Transcript_3509/g.7304 Transcript_3509/m.7304 type:complete len:263 (+) Transcript_3509:1690-2478(+)
MNMSNIMAVIPNAVPRGEIHLGVEGGCLAASGVQRGAGAHHEGELLLIDGIVDACLGHVVVGLALDLHVGVVRGARGEVPLLAGHPEVQGHVHRRVAHGVLAAVQGLQRAPLVVTEMCTVIGTILLAGAEGLHCGHVGARESGRGAIGLVFKASVRLCGNGVEHCGEFEKSQQPARTCFNLKACLCKDMSDVIDEADRLSINNDAANVSDYHHHCSIQRVRPGHADISEYRQLHVGQPPRDHKGFHLGKVRVRQAALQRPFV